MKRCLVSIGMRLVNILITSVPLLVLAAYLATGGKHLTHWVDCHPHTNALVVLIVMILSLATLLSAFAAFFWALVYVPASGDGLLWRCVTKYDFLEDPDGSIFKKFDETEWIWRWDPIFRGRRLATYSFP